MPNVPISLWSKWQIGHGKWFLNTNLFPSNRSLLPSLTVSIYCVGKEPNRKCTTGNYAMFYTFIGRSSQNWGGATMYTYHFWPGVHEMQCQYTPYCLRHLVFSAIFTYNSYLPSIFGTNALIWGYFWNIILWYLSFCITYKSKSLRNNKKDK